MEAKLTIALFLFGLSSFLTQNLTAALAIAVAHDNSLSSVSAVSAEAVQKCKARGGADAKVAGTFFKAANGAVAVSDNGTGKIVGLSWL